MYRIPNQLRPRRRSPIYSWCLIKFRCVGLDNLGDQTPEQERLIELATVDEDKTGSIDFEEFLQVTKRQLSYVKLRNLVIWLVIYFTFSNLLIQVLYNLERGTDVSVTLGKTFNKADGDVKFIRHMSLIQQLRSGLL